MQDVVVIKGIVFLLLGHDNEVINARAVVEATVDGNDHNMMVKMTSKEIVALNALCSAIQERFITEMKE